MDRVYDLPGGITVTRVQPNIGAVLSGIDLSQPLSEEQAESLRRALYAHGVIFMRGQEAMTFEDHRALARVFGKEICDGPDPERPQITPVKASAGSKEGTASTWHIDGAYTPEPPVASILRAIDPCTFGGDTCWSSGVAAYEGLPDEVKEKIRNLKYNSSLAARMPRNYNHFGSGDNWDKLHEKYPPVVQPAVAVHPATGARSLYVNQSWTITMADMDEEEGQALIALLTGEILRPEYQTRWQWQKGDVAIWDNRLVHHYGVPDHTTDRLLERITVSDGPIISIADWEARGEKVAEEV